MKITCTLDTLGDALKDIKKFKKELPKKVKELAEHLADVGVQTAQGIYGGSGSVTKAPTKNGYKILAEGRAVCFMEFGTGVYADDSNLDKYDNLTFKVEPGSWSESEEGAHTWSKWIDAGNDPNAWPYNRTARPGMFLAYQAIVAAIQEEAEKVFQ